MTTLEIDNLTALKISKGWEIISASDISYFKNPYWQGRTRKAEKVEGEKRIIFTLYNNDFVEVEG